MRFLLGFVLVFVLAACGENPNSGTIDAPREPESSAPATTAPAPSSSPTPKDVISDQQRAAWKRASMGERGAFALRAARSTGWMGTPKNFTETALVVCESLARYKVKDVTARTAWTRILTQVRFGQTIVGEQVVTVVGNFVGGACPNLGKASEESLVEILEAGGFQ